jgi:hypothetical protein
VEFRQLFRFPQFDNSVAARSLGASNMFPS